MLRLPAIFAGAVLSIVSVAAAGALIAPRTPLPRAVRFVNGALLFSLCVFTLLQCNIGYLAIYGGAAVLLVVLARRAQPVFVCRLPRMAWFPLATIGAYVLMYLVFALAPETQPDAVGYHLRLVADYARLHAFANRLTFYDVMPQGMEMLFVPAYALGGPVGAKLVHFAFLIATIPLIREITRELGLAPHVGSTAAALFFLAPVCGIAGTAAYTDAGLVCAGCATLYLLIRWERERLNSLLFCAALNAGFCYAIKPTFGWVAVAAFGFVAVRSRRRAASLTFASLALAIGLPWMLRAYLLSGNPVAPFLNAWFPNPVSTVEIENHLAANYSAFRSGFPMRTALLDYTVSGGNQGLLGTAFLLLPLSLLSLRNWAGKWLLASAALLALPIAANTGTRFLLPAMAPAAIAMASVLPGPFGVAILALQAIGAAPPVIALYDNGHEWRLGRPPLAAALGLTPENAFLERFLPAFDVARMIQSVTGPDAKILACTSVPEVYARREILVYWHSAAAQQFTDALHFANMSHGTRARQLSWRWSGGDYRSLRLTALSDLRLVEASFSHGAPPAQSWKMYRPGEAVKFAAAPGVTGADLLIWPGDQARENTEGLSVSGTWQPLESRAERCAQNIDLRRDATAYIRRSGYHYLLIPVANNAFAEIGLDMVRHPAEWGLETAGAAGGIWLFRILPGLL